MLGMGEKAFDLSGMPGHSELWLSFLLRLFGGLKIVIIIIIAHILHYIFASFVVDVYISESRKAHNVNARAGTARSPGRNLLPALGSLVILLSAESSAGLPARRRGEPLFAQCRFEEGGGIFWGVVFFSV